MRSVALARRSRSFCCSPIMDIVLCARFPTEDVKATKRNSKRKNGAQLSTKFIRVSPIVFPVLRFDSGPTWFYPRPVVWSRVTRTAGRPRCARNAALFSTLRAPTCNGQLVQLPAIGCVDVDLFTVVFGHTKLTDDLQIGVLDRPKHRFGGGCEGRGVE